MGWVNIKLIFFSKLLFKNVQECFLMPTTFNLNIMKKKKIWSQWYKSNIVIKRQKKICQNLFTVCFFNYHWIEVMYCQVLILTSSYRIDSNLLQTQTHADLSFDLKVDPSPPTYLHNLLFEETPSFASELWIKVKEGSKVLFFLEKRENKFLHKLSVTSVTKL